MAALRLASALVGQNCQTVKENTRSQGNNESQRDRGRAKQYRGGYPKCSSFPDVPKQKYIYIFKSFTIQGNKAMMLHLEAPEAAAAWKADVADVRRAV